MKIGKDEAVSPVIGVILMVAITVILAAVIAAFVFGMGTPTQAPQASIVISSTSATASTINITHRGGDSIDLGKTKAIIIQGGNRMEIATLNSTTGSNFFQVGDEVGFYANTAANATSAPFAVSKNKAGSASGTVTNTNLNLATGKVTLTLIDTDSTKEIARIAATVTS